MKTLPLLLTGFISCIPAKVVKTQTLAPVDKKPVEVKFLGTPGKVDELYVCKLATETHLDCIGYKHFQDELQKL